MKMNAQEVFDKVATHLLGQNRRSVREGLDDGAGNSCAYRGQDGCKCAIGCLIPDDKYDPKLEGIGVEAHFVYSVLPIDRSTVSPHFLRNLQNIHDRHPVAYWKEALENQANIHGLTADCLKEMA